MRKLKGMFLSCAIVFITLLHCSTPESPFTNIANVNATVTVQTPQSGWITGDTIDIQIKLSILSFVDSISVHFGDSATEMIKRDSLSDMGVVVVRHIYGVPGDYGIYTTIYLNNNSTKTTKTEPITLKTHVVYHANSSTLGSVPKDSSVYAKGEKVTLKGNTDSLSKTGYDFSGWNTKADGTGSNYNAGSDFIIGANNDLFARWIPSQTTTPKPDNFTYPTNPATYVTGTPISANTPTWTGGNPTQFLVNPSLPMGLTLNAVTGAIFGSPTHVTATATYTITASNTGGFSQTSVILTINPVSTINRVPEFVSGTGNISILENQTANITIVAHDSDMTDTIRWTLVKSPAVDSVIAINPTAMQWNALRDTARLTFAPGTRAGNYAVTIRISDRKDSASATITISVGNVNHPPKWAVKDSSLSLKEGQAFSLPLKPLCTDQDGNAITFTLASGTPATDSIGSDGIYRYTPGYSDAGTYTVKVAASDGTLTDTLSLTLTVANTNRKPVWVHPSITATISEGHLLTLPLKDSASDPDSDPLVFTLLPGTPAGDAISAANAYTFTPTMTDSGSYTVKITVSDGLLADTLTIALRVTNLDTDRTPPTLRRLDPATDSTTLSANATQIKVIAKDSSGVASVTMVLGANTFNATRSGDSIWTANITGLLSNVYNTITVTATDVSAGANTSQLAIRIKYDPTMTDNSGPTITAKSGIISDTMIRTAILTSTLEITDASGLDSLFWTLNGTFGGMLLAVSGQQDQYRLLDTLTTYHQNTVVVWAVDKSTNKNRRSVSFAVNYNTLPSGVTAVAPVNAATGVENVGLKLVWRKSVDADGDGVSYVVRYGVDAANLAMAAPMSDTGYTPAPALLGHRDYFWIVQCVSGTDTVRSPAVGTFTFSTKNHAPVITGRTPSNNAYNIAIQPSLSWNSSEPDGDAYRTKVLFGTTVNSLSATDVGTATSYSPSTLTAGIRYFWAIRIEETAVNGLVFNTDTMSFWTQAPVPAITITAPVTTNDSAFVTSLSPTISGTASSTVGIQSVTSSLGTLSGTTTWSITGLSLTAKTWTPITITAKSAANDQAQKTIVLCYAPPLSADTAATPVVTGLSDSSISIAWTVPANCDSVRLYRSVTGIAGSFALIATRTGTTYTDMPLKPCKTYYYQVRGVYRIAGIGGRVDSTGVSRTGSASTNFWFQKSFSGMAERTIAKQTSDGGYIVAGTTSTGGLGGNDLLLIKTDVSGDTIWTRPVGSTADETASHIIELSNGMGYVVAGVQDLTNIYVVKTDAVGRKIYETTVTPPGSSIAVPSGIIQTATGFLMTGTWSDSIWVGSFTENLAYLGGTKYAIGTSYCISPTVDGNFIVGVMCPQGGTSYPAGLLKVSPSGTKLWLQPITTSTSGAIHVPNSVVETSTGGFLLCGYAMSMTPGNDKNFEIIRTDANGLNQTSVSLGTSGTYESGACVIEATDRNFVLVGTQQTASNAYDIWFLKLSSTNLTTRLIDKTYGGILNETSYSIKQTTDGGYIIGAGSESYSGGVLLIKTDANGNTISVPK